MRRTLHLGVLVVLASCQSDAAATKENEPGPTIKLAGVFPDRFQCASILTTDALAAVLGGATAVRDAPMSNTRGVARACNYEVAAATVENWSFDFDCRAGYKKSADDLFEQYKQWTVDRIAKYDEVSDAGVKPPPPPKNSDAAVVEHKRPGNWSEVSVGAKGLDHNDSAILFIDDDAPCYVRVNGPDATRRLELAKLVAKNLTFANAPMDPRPFK